MFTLEQTLPGGRVSSCPNCPNTDYSTVLNVQGQMRQHVCYVRGQMTIVKNYMSDGRWATGDVRRATGDGRYSMKCRSNALRSEVWLSAPLNDNKDLLCRVKQGCMVVTETACQHLASSPSLYSHIQNNVNMQTRNEMQHQR